MYKHYMDGTLVIWQHGLETLHGFVTHLILFFDTINFIMELVEKEKLPFLDSGLVQ